MKLNLISASLIICSSTSVFGGVIADDPVKSACDVKTGAFDTKSVIEKFDNNYIGFRKEGNINMICYFLHSEEADIKDARNSLGNGDRRALFRTWEHMKERRELAASQSTCKNLNSSFQPSQVKEALKNKSIFRDLDMLCVSHLEKLQLLLMCCVFSMCSQAMILKWLPFARITTLV